MYNRHKDLNAMLNKVIEKVANNIKEQADHSKSLGNKRLTRIGREKTRIITVYNPEREELETDE